MYWGLPSIVYIPENVLKWKGDMCLFWLEIAETGEQLPRNTVEGCS